MKKIFLLSFCFILISVEVATAQNNTSFNSTTSYTTAVGVKFYPGAISVKHFTNDNTAVELLGYFWNKGVRITGLYEIHGDIDPINGLKWYLGPGAHVGFYDSKYGGGSSIGVDGVLGLDYKINGAPINISIDWQPSFEFGNRDENGFVGNWGGFAIRYTL
jgi:hypothetical protein